MAKFVHLCRYAARQRQRDIKFSKIVACGYFTMKRSEMVKSAILAGVSKANGSPWPSVSKIAACGYFTILE